MKHVLTYLGEAEDAPGEAAETGSVAHAAIAAYHRAPGHREGVKAGLAAIRESCLDRFRRASPEDAARHFAVERAVRLVLPPAEGDPTGREVVIEGTLDQVRRHEGRLIVVDVKTGATPGWQMLHDHMFQVVAYAAAATAELGEPVEPGYLIRTQGYRRRGIRPADAPEGVFWPFGLTPDRCRVYLNQVRAGAVRPRPALRLLPHGRDLGLHGSGGEILLKSCIAISDAILSEGGSSFRHFRFGKDPFHAQDDEVDGRR